MAPEPFQANAVILTPINSRLLSMPSPVLYSLNDAIWTETYQANLKKLRTPKTADIIANFECIYHSTHFHYPLEFQKSDCPQRSKIFPIIQFVAP
jgi:hypothetical protein